MKKKPGSIMDMLSVGISIIALSIIMICCLNIMQLASGKEEVRQLSRQYILRMETVGYLTAADKTQMLHDLEELGLEDVDLTGTTFTDAGYGNPVILIIQGSLHMQNAAGDNLLNMIFEQQTYQITIKRMSTAKN